ncbi:hypothetical protein TNCV_3170871 [Trichonephila clavipes]|nr:hypothetical protein TNCV_3170871 [Trichonephila clavipes]
MLKKLLAGTGISPRHSPIYQEGTRENLLSKWCDGWTIPSIKNVDTRVSRSVRALTHPNDPDIYVPLLRYLDETFHRVHRLQLQSS